MWLLQAAAGIGASMASSGRVVLMVMRGHQKPRRRVLSANDWFMLWGRFLRQYIVELEGSS